MCFASLSYLSVCLLGPGDVAVILLWVLCVNILFFSFCLSEMGLGPGRSLTLGPYLSCSSWQTFLSAVEKAGTGVALGGVGGPCPLLLGP